MDRTAFGASKTGSPSCAMEKWHAHRLFKIPRGEAKKDPQHCRRRTVKETCSCWPAAASRGPLNTPLVAALVVVAAFF